MLHRKILIAIGANLPGSDGQTPRDTCDWAVQRLAVLPGLRLLARSRWYRSAPFPPSDQPDYVNGVVRLAGDAEPLSLLNDLHAIEAEAGRVRSVPNAARPLDLDLLAMDDLVLEGAVNLPHPRLHQRAFVLLPLLDVDPFWVHPRLGPALALKAAIDPTGTAPLDDEDPSNLHFPSPNPR